MGTKTMVTPQRQVQFVDMATSTSIVSERPVEHLVEWTPHIGASQVPQYKQDPLKHLGPLKHVFQEGFGHSLQVVATELKS